MATRLPLEQKTLGSSPSSPAKKATSFLRYHLNIIVILDAKARSLLKNNYNNMSLTEIQQAAIRALHDEKIPTTNGSCRDAVQLLLILAHQADITPPNATIHALVWPRELVDKDAQNIHYAFFAQTEDEKLYINPVKAAGFPVFNQISSCPPGFLGNMIITENVI